ncbi:MAG: SRPBCC family protein [Flavobacteriaceae bacterium]
MKILKYFLLLLVVVIAGGLIYTATIPSDYDVSRSKVIKAPIGTAFNTVNDLKTWEEWGPWHDDDPTIAITYGDKTVGVGASSSWTSKDGPGSLKMVAAVPNKSIQIEMQFGDYDPTKIEWTFEEVEEGTKITWSMSSTNNPFMFKMFAAMSGGWDGMFGPMEAKGLENLDGVLAKEVEKATSFRIGEVTSVDLVGGSFIGYLHKTSTDLDHEGMTKIFMESLPKAGMYAVQKGLKLGDYVPGSVFTKWDEETKEAEFYVGLLLNKKLKPAEGMEVISMPKGKGVMIAKFGNYGIGDMEAHGKIAQYLETNKLTPTGLVWELYMNDPMSVKPQDIQTDIYYSLK